MREGRVRRLSKLSLGKPASCLSPYMSEHKFRILRNKAEEPQRSAGRLLCTILYAAATLTTSGTIVENDTVILASNGTYFTVATITGQIYSRFRLQRQIYQFIQ